MDHSALQINFSIISSITDVEKAAKRAHKGKIEPRRSSIFYGKRKSYKAYRQEGGTVISFT